MPGGIGLHHHADHISGGGSQKIEPESSALINAIGLVGIGLHGDDVGAVDGQVADADVSTDATVSEHAIHTVNVICVVWIGVLRVIRRNPDGVCAHIDVTH